MEKSSEQDRDHRERYGMANYIWAPDSKHLMFDSNGSLWIYDLSNGTGIDIGYSGEGSGDDPKSHRTETMFRSFAITGWPWFGCVKRERRR